MHRAPGPTLARSSTVTPDNGLPQDIGPGDVAVFAKGWRGRIAFQGLGGVLPGGSELQPVSGVIKSDGQSLSFDGIKGIIGGGEPLM